MEFARTTRKLRAISMISLIDIVFTVILFFLIAGHLEKFSIVPIELPMANSGQVLNEGPVAISLGRYNEILLNDQLYDYNTIAGELRRQLANNPERVITIKADANLEANKLVGFLEIIRAAGGVNLSIVTQSATMPVTR